MDAQEVTVDVRDSGGGGVNLGSEKFEQQVSSLRECESSGVEFLEDYDSYWEDINGRLTISRMVSDSVIKGMVRAVEQAAEERIAEKDLEVERLKEKMHFHQLGADKSDSSGSSLSVREATSEENGYYRSFSDDFVEHDKLRESLGNLKNVAREQIKKLNKEIDSIRGCSSMRRISSGSELVGLGGILQEKASESFAGVDKTLHTLEMTVAEIYTKADEMFHLSKASGCEWQQEQEFRRELEAMVTQTSIRSLHEEYEEKLWDLNTQLCGVNWVERINEVSNLRKELDAISRSLSNPETGQLISYGSRDMDHFPRKALVSHVSISTPLWEGNGVFEESKNGMPDNWDAQPLKHMKKDELVNYFNNMMTEMRRNHESKVQEMTEEYFRLKREYLKENGSSLPHRKDKDMEMLRKKIPEVILKLDDILVENEKLSALSNNDKTLGSLKDRLNSLLLENRQLRDSLSDKREEVNRLSSQVSDAAEKMLQHSMAEANLLKLIAKLKSEVKDTEIEASVTEGVYECFLRAVTPHINRDTDKLELQSIVMPEIKEILYREASQDAEATSKCEIEDSDIESLVMQGLCEVIFKEATKDAQLQINELTTKYLHENENRVSLDLKALEREEELRLVIEEKERLKQEVHSLSASLEEKEKLGLEISAVLVKEKEQFQLASQEIRNLKDQTSGMQTLVTERSRELDFIKGKLEQNEVDKGKINILNRKLELVMKELREADEHRNMLLATTQEKQNDILLLEAKENEQRKQMQAVIVLVSGLSRALSHLESQVAEHIQKNNLRFEESGSQLRSLIQNTNLLKTTAAWYRKSFERRCNDLQMAEAEVDLLGDEVDALLSLLEKIYIALDHYSPIFQHYPGVIEILKLVRRELSGEFTKSI